MQEFIHNNYNPIGWSGWTSEASPEANSNYSAIETNHLIPLIGYDFHQDIASNTVNYTPLISGFIVPFMEAFFKLYSLNYEIAFNNFNPTNNPLVFALLSDYNRTAMAKKKDLLRELKTNAAAYPLYTPPTASFINGIKLST